MRSSPFLSVLCFAFFVLCAPAVRADVVACTITGGTAGNASPGNAFINVTGIDGHGSACAANAGSSNSWFPSPQQVDLAFIGAGPFTIASTAQIFPSDGSQGGVYWMLSFNFISQLIPVSAISGPTVHLQVMGTGCITGNAFADIGLGPFNLGPLVETVSYGTCQSKLPAILTADLVRDASFSTLYHYSGAVTWTLDPTPEPAAIILLGSGISTLALGSCFSRRRRV